MVSMYCALSGPVPSAFRRTEMCETRVPSSTKASAHTPLEQLVFGNWTALRLYEQSEDLDGFGRQGQMLAIPK
jgi:hypothetical protein